MSLYTGDWSLYREDMCICPKCGKDEITHCDCDYWEEEYTSYENRSIEDFGKSINDTSIIKG